MRSSPPPVLSGDGAAKSASFAIVTLGCPKNEADSGALERRLRAAGYPAAAPLAADLIIVNTCGFIDAAKEESIDAILELAEEAHGRGARLAAVGCLVERYREELVLELPEVDVWAGFEDGPLFSALAGIAADHAPVTPSLGLTRRRGLPRPVHAYLKISDGCDRRCAYCAIPLIKGSYEVREPGVVLDEAGVLLAAGARELILVGQDTSRWRWPAYGGLARLLADLRSLDALWLRLLYLQPDGVDAQLLEAMAAHAVPYVDLPLQHASREVLRRMGRGGDGDTYLELLDHVRQTLPGVAVRSTFLVGFPGEGEGDVDRLIDFIDVAGLAVAGVFVFDPQEGTPAWSLAPAVPRELAQERAARVGEAIERAASAFWSSLKGSVVDVLIESGSRGEPREAIGRIALQAPDVDGITQLRTAAPVRRGDLVRAVVEDGAGYVLTARALTAAAAPPSRHA